MKIILLMFISIGEVHLRKLEGQKMSVKAASQLLTRAMRGAVKETMSPDSEKGESRSIEEASKVSRQFGLKLHRSTNLYTGAVDPFGYPNNTVDSWRSQFSGPSRAANDSGKSLKDG